MNAEFILYQYRQYMCISIPMYLIIFDYAAFLLALNYCFVILRIVNDVSF